ncbi:MAG: class I SAM-dependent methyltransferase [Bacteriovorax sp.]|nr:class I SAM-dependent methyltransferase [Bacteriovorax sp.]
MQNKKYKDLEVYFDLMLANGASSLYRIVQEMEILNSYKLGEKFTAEDLALKHQFKLLPTKVLLDSLVTLGLVEKAGESYTISNVMNLLTGNYQNLSSEYWAHLPTLLKSGTPFKRMDTVENSEKEYQVQVKSLEWMMTPCAELTVEIISKLHPEKKIKDIAINVLDIGAGSGVWSFNFLYANPKANCTLADWPAVLKVAKETSEKNKIDARVSYIEGNFHHSDFGAPRFDYATLGNVTHIQTPEENKRIFKKIYDALLPGGRLVILDAYGKVEEGALARSLYQMGLTIRTVQGKVYGPSELEPWLKEAGFSSFEFHSLDVVPYSMGMLIAKK